MPECRKCGTELVEGENWPSPRLGHSTLPHQVGITNMR